MCLRYPYVAEIHSLFYVAALPVSDGAISSIYIIYRGRIYVESRRISTLMGEII